VLIVKDATGQALGYFYGEDARSPTARRGVDSDKLGHHMGIADEEPTAGLFF